MICAVSNIQEKLCSKGKDAVDPSLLYEKLLGYWKVEQYTQQDAHECLKYLIEGIKEALPPTYLNHYFSGKMMSAVRCEECEHLSQTLEHFEDLQLGMATTIEGALKMHFACDRIEEYKCDNCKKSGDIATKQCSIFEAPESLCIQLKRYSVQGKNSDFISFGTKIDLTESSENLSPIDWYQ